MKPVTSKHLAARLDDKFQQTAAALDDALSWVNSQRQQVPCLEQEADWLTVKLRQLSNQARHFAAASQQPCAVGFYGLAQAGKTYLIQSLLHAENSRLVIDAGGHPLDYAQQINPWQQTATLVQRFTRQPQTNSKKWPLQLLLLSETEIVSMLFSVWLQRLPATMPADSLLATRLKNLLRYRQREALAGITCADMAALRVCCNRACWPQQAVFDRHFWPLATTLAPWLNIDERAQLFSLLWHDAPDLTALYRQLAHVLHQLGHARQVAAPAAAIDDAGCSLLTTSALQDFNTPAALTLQVCPRRNGKLLKSVTLSLSELTILAREISFPLHQAPQLALFEQADILDFPASGATDESDHRAMPLALEAIQAKRSLLLTLASEAQQMHWLLVCTASTDRTNTRLPAAMLTGWLNQTQSDQPDQHAGRQPGLIWALTPYDHKVTGGENYDLAIQRAIGQPGKRWESMTVSDDKGLLRLASWLTSEVKQDRRLTHLSGQHQELCRELRDNVLARWLADDSTTAPSAKQRIASQVIKALQQRTGVHGELLERLLPTRDSLRYLFIQQHQRELAQHDGSTLGTAHPFSIGISLDLLSTTPQALVSPQIDTPSGGEHAVFAHQVYCFWINHLRQLPDNRSLQLLLDVSKPVLEMLTTELITGSLRLEIEQALQIALSDSTLNALPVKHLAERQVSLALGVLSDYVTWLGFQTLAEDQKPDSRIHPGAKIFARPVSIPPAAAGQRLARLPEVALNNAAYYIYDWLIALNQLIVQNAGYPSSPAVSGSARQQLVNIITQATAGCSTENRSDTVT
ncbi:hypothetical protein BL250_11990 [Erwinia sp. OLTSP20]|uniref:virulence factor SrfC family protein n=1 Tax=unclassified Erwinia TaxID=2622719 RepID=UPI000C17E18D|nr:MULTISPECIES: virulence factor SrfC family protein [unclassified Erwinia]PIJ49528.1 hypothetical protein BV501_12480 [Erwinia sp. OAMSP11]PIJ71194.1 hypothetical protein BK416_11960 [Erwinia sp. OLSSP12]PIJ79843.1 hypothetical protein BLD47_12730 [Erwinia sp. OLCASP19]PIJ81606.1 hypothetical protein BLD46_12575 [Erwinia sp. OLMTSP26]PIJ84021.1 hypothetical protein BLD49_12670 [Erwinia sp. OLMDSP33]